MPAWLQISLRKWLSSGTKVTFWRPFCLCKLDGQELKIPLGNRVFPIQHTQIRLKSLVPNFYSKMLLTFTLFRNLTSLFCRCMNVILETHTLSNKRQLHWLYTYADVRSILRNEHSEALARAYNLHVCFSRYIWGLAPPPPIPKTWLRYWWQE